MGGVVNGVEPLHEIQNERGQGVVQFKGRFKARAQLADRAGMFLAEALARSLGRLPQLADQPLGLDAASLGTGHRRNLHEIRGRDGPSRSRMVARRHPRCDAADEVSRHRSV